jgi:hypothetical protein
MGADWSQRRPRTGRRGAHGRPRPSRRWPRRCPRSGPAGPRDRDGRCRRSRCPGAAGCRPGSSGPPPVGRRCRCRRGRGAQRADLHADHHRVPVPATQRLTDEELVVAHAVVVAGVEQADPGVQGRADRGDALRLVGRAVGAGHAHAAQPDRRHVRTGGSQPSCDHQPPLMTRSFGNPTNGRRLPPSSESEGRFESDLGLKTAVSEHMHSDLVARLAYPSDHPLSANLALRRRALFAT